MCAFEPEEKAHSSGEEIETKLTEFGSASPPESGKFLSFGPVESSVLAKQVPSCLPHGCSPAERRMRLFGDNHLLSLGSDIWEVDGQQTLAGTPGSQFATCLLEVDFQSKAMMVKVTFWTKDSGPGAPDATGKSEAKNK